MSAETRTNTDETRDPAWDYGRMPVRTRMWRTVVGAVSLPFLFVAGVITSELGDGQPTGVAKAMTWAIEPFTKPKKRPPTEAADR